ncbi:hypothetical protein KJ781_02400 [Patescibacteria group bacterium]|nr:hypothetical protein [Patescibacteria group bacterium]MBU1448217.1 hypothetical protein [Patescibacteria group bacterium]MBU2612998.1 hypothetical protein [Patescibacteria group bacterium]
MHIRILASAVFLSLVFSGFVLVHEVSAEKYFAPSLSFSPPGLDWSKYPIVRSGNSISIPFLAVYIGTFYQYAVGVAIIAAAIMIVYGGFKYIVGSTGVGVKGGKDVISDAIVGLLLILGSYTILQVMNPSLTVLPPIKVTVIKGTPFEFVDSALQRTYEETGITPTVGPQSSSVVIPEGTAQSETPAFTNCPVTLTNPLTVLPSGKDAGKSYLAIAKDQRTQEFFEKIKPLITGVTFNERLEQAANAALKCDVHLGTCANTAANIWALTDAIDSACLKGVCKVSTMGKDSNVKSVKGLSTSVSLKIINLRCTNEKPCEPNPSCIKDGAEARAEVKKLLQEMPDYPTGWLTELQPGDYIQVYNGNASCGGQHSALFVGWKSDGLAQLVQGPGWGKNPNSKTICLKPSCGNWTPITAIVRPK